MKRKGMMRMRVFWILARHAPLAFATAFAVLQGCTVPWQKDVARVNETAIELKDGNFETFRVHAVGQGKCHYVFFLPVSGSPDVVSTAWKQMKTKADLTDQAAQFVNVTEQRTRRWFIWPFYWQVVHTVSADAIAFK